ncbi:MAG: ABC transporter substrate-binding protein [Tissierellia bacterium]|nr:ABC transporter substrate-binding protein [Tissierellia bacterium]
MKRIISLLLSLLMVLALFTACTPANNNGDANGEPDEVVEPGEEDADVIKIGVFEPLTGMNGGGGLQELGGIEYANKMYPEVLGKKIELVVVDNKSDKGEATTAVTRLIEKDKVVAIIGSYGSAVSIAAGDIIRDAQVPTVAPSATNPMVTQGNDFYFRACFLDPFQGEVMATYAIEQGAKTAAVIMQNGDDYSVGLANFFINAFKKLTGDDASVVDVSEFQLNEADFNAILTNIKAKNPDVIFAPSAATTAPLIIKQARDLGIESLIMGGDTWENPAVIDVAGEDAEGIVLSTFFDENDPATNEAVAFVEGYKAELAGSEPIIPAVAALGYDAYILVRDAIERAGSTDGVAIRDALKETKDFEGVTGIINFTEEGDADKNVAVIKSVQDGQFVFIDSVEVK